jgi:hypothetical protein
VPAGAERRKPFFPAGIDADPIQPPGRNHELTDGPDARFYRLIDSARLPQRADRSAAGTLPARAAKFCDAVTTASAFGWYIFPPTEFSLLWDGADIFWNVDPMPGWMPLGAAQFPGFSAAFDAAAPDVLRGCSPPFLTALPEPGTLQIWTGLMARTAPGWSLLVRPPANLPLPGGYAMYEGLLECDRWFGPLFTNIRLTRTDVPLRLRADFPLLQVQPIERIAYSDDILKRMAVVPDMTAFTDLDWNDYRVTVAVPNEDKDRPLGQVAAAARRRRKTECPQATSPAG